MYFQDSIVLEALGIPIFRTNQLFKLPRGIYICDNKWKTFLLINFWIFHPHQNIGKSFFPHRICIKRATNFSEILMNNWESHKESLNKPWYLSSLNLTQFKCSNPSCFLKLHKENYENLWKLFFNQLLIFKVLFLNVFHPRSFVVMLFIICGILMKEKLINFY